MSIIKRTVGLLILYVFTLAMTFPVLAGEKESHWAQKEMDILFSQGIISGDPDGGLRPDESILRAEFVKTVNRIFEISEKGEEQFRDIKQNDWYYDEFSSALKYGYLRGDSAGNGNPNLPITRAEVCVILSRILKLDDYPPGALSFADSEKIPQWALGAIGALYNEGLISGYPCGEFKCENPMTRAEAFYMLHYSSLRPAEENISYPTQVGKSGNIGSMNVIGGGGFGSSGGGQSPSLTSPDKIFVPMISSIQQEDDILKFYGVTNAVSYEINIVSGVYSEKVIISAGSSGNEHSVDLTEAFNKISANFDDADILYSITIRAVAKSGYLDSDISSATTITKIYPALDTPAPKVRKGYADGIPRGIIFWDAIPNAASYTVGFAYANGNPVDPGLYAYDSVKREVLIPDLRLLDSEAFTEVKAITADKAVIKNSLPGNISVSGAESVIPIYTAKQFEQIRNEPSKNYILMNSLDLGNFEPIENFTGTLTTKENKMLSLKVNINKPGVNDVGIFKTIIGKGSISNIIIDGAVTGGTNVGALAGRITETSVISNCINMASVTGTSSVGGFVGINGSVIKNSINAGAVSGSTIIGGITGYNQKTIEYCGNIGSVSGTGMYAGGIAGSSWNGTISYSYNTGNVTTTYGTAGGILAYTNSPSNTITGSYNQGTITSTTQGGGLVGQLGSASAGVSITDCYNTGELNSGTVYPIAGTAMGSVSISSSFYTKPDVDDGIANTTLLSELELQDKNNESVIYLLSKKYEFAEDDNDFPSIVGSSQITNSDIKLYPVAHSVSAVFNEGDGEILFSWDNPVRDDIVKMELSVYNNTDILCLEDNENINTNTTQYTLQGAESGILYEIRIVYTYADGNSAATVFEFKAED